MRLSCDRLLELPPKMLFDGQLWMTITTKVLYYLFGSVGAVIEVGAIMTAMLFALLPQSSGAENHPSPIAILLPIEFGCGICRK